MPLPQGFELENNNINIPEGFEIEQKPAVPEGFKLEERNKKEIDPSLPQYLKYKLNMDRASSERSKYGNLAMWGAMDTQEALRKGNIERDYWSTQAGQYDNLSFKKHPFKYVAGEAVQLIPYMLSSQAEGLKYGMTIGGGFAAITAAAGQAGPQAVLPEEMITVPTAFAAGMGTGYSYGVVKNILDREGGGLYLDLVEKGISENTARNLSVAGGTLIGIIELAQFKMLSKPFKQAFSKAIKSKVGKLAITKAIGRYIKTVGGELLEEDLQEITSLTTETIAGLIDEKPDAIPTKEEWIKRLIETTKRAGAGLAVISMPGAAVDITTSIKTDKIVKTKEDMAMLDKIIAESKLSENLSSVEKQQLTDIWNKAHGGKEPPKKPPIEIKKEKVDISPKRLKPDITGISSLQKQIQKIEDKETRVVVAQDSLDEINKIRRWFKNSIKKYKGDYLKEELTGIPKYYISTKETAMTPDEAIESFNNNFNIKINNENELKEYLISLENDKKELEEDIEYNKPGYITKKETTVLKDKIKSIETGIREGIIQGKEQVKSSQEELISMIEDFKLEPKDKAKFIRAIKNVQTPQQLEKAIPKIMERIGNLKEQAERKTIISDLKNLFTNKSTKNLPIEYKETLDSLKSRILLKGISEKTKKRLSSMQNFIERMKAQGEEINIPEEKLIMLDKITIDQMNTEDLKDLQDITERLFHQGKLKNKLISNVKQREFDKVKTQIIETVTKGKGLNQDSTIIKALKEQNKNFIDKDIAWIKDRIIPNLRPELLCNIIDGLQEGTFTETVFNSLWDSQKTELNESKKVIDTIKDIHKGIDFSKFFSKKEDIGRFKGMTKDQAMFIYANSFNSSNKAHLEGSGITDKDISAIRDSLTDNEKKAVTDMIRFYDEYQYPALDKVYSEIEGIHLGKEYNYFPIDRIEDISYNKELEKDILERNYIRRTGVSKGFTKERVSSNKGFSEFSYFGTILRNYRKVEHYKAFAKSIRDANKVFNNIDIKNVIKDKFGDQYYKIMEKWLKDIAYGGDKQVMSSIDKVSQWLRTNYATAVIGGNLLSVMKAPISFMQGMERAGKFNTFKGLLKFIQAPLDWNNKISEKSTLMKFRSMNQERELTEIISQRTLRGQIDKVTGTQLLKEKSMLLWTVADKTTCDIIWLSSYDSAKADGMSENKAIDYADMIIRRTQPMSGALNLPDTFRGPEYQKFFTIFRNQPNQNFNLLTESILKKQAGKINSKEFISNLSFYLLVPAIIISAISRKRLPEDALEFSKDVLNGAFGGLIYIGNITNLIASGFLGATTPLDSLYEDIYSMVKSKDITKKLDNLAEALSKMYGIPYIGIKRIVTGKPFGTSKNNNKKLKPI